MAERRLEDNSFAAREARARSRGLPRAEKVIQGSAKRVKKPLGQRVLDYILGDGINKATDYVKYDVLSPGIQRLLFDIIVNSASMALLGKPFSGSGRRLDDSGGGQRRSYDRMYRDYDYPRETYPTRRRRASYDCDDITFDTWEDAQTALYHLKDDLKQFATVRVSTLCGYADITPQSTDFSYGWSSLDGITDKDIYPTEDGRWVIDLPPCERMGR